MSTKIYDAWLLPRETDLPDLVRDLDKQVSARAVELETEAVGRAALKQIDLFWLAKNSGRTGPVMPVSPAFSASVKAAEARRSSSSESPYQFEAVFLKDPATERVGVKLFFNGSAYRTAVDKIADKWAWTEYDYWDNTDRPDDVTETEWNGRLGFWKRATAPDWTFTRGLSYKLHHAGILQTTILVMLEQLQPAPMPAQARLNAMVLERVEVPSAVADRSSWWWDFVSELTAYRYSPSMLSKLSPEVRLDGGYYIDPSHSLRDADIDRVVARVAAKIEA